MRPFLRAFLVTILFLVVLAFTQSQASIPLEITINRDGVLLKGKVCKSPCFLHSLNKQGGFHDFSFYIDVKDYIIFY